MSGYGWTEARRDNGCLARSGAFAFLLSIIRSSASESTMTTMRRSHGYSCVSSSLPKLTGPISFIAVSRLTH